MGKTNKLELPEITPEFIEEMKLLYKKYYEDRMICIESTNIKYDKSKKTLYSKHSEDYMGLYNLYFMSNGLGGYENAPKIIKSFFQKEFQLKHLKISVRKQNGVYSWDKWIFITFDFSDSSLSDYELFLSTTKPYYKNGSRFSENYLNQFKSESYGRNDWGFSLEIIKPINYEVRKTSSLANTVFQPL